MNSLIPWHPTSLSQPSAWSTSSRAQLKRSTSDRAIFNCWEPCPGNRKPTLFFITAFPTQTSLWGLTTNSPWEGGVSRSSFSSSLRRSISSSGVPAITVALIGSPGSSSRVRWKARSASSHRLNPFAILLTAAIRCSKAETDAAVRTMISVSWLETKSDRSSIDGSSWAAGASPDSRVTWQLIPPNPIAETPARRISVWLRISPSRIG